MGLGQQCQRDQGVRPHRCDGGQADRSGDGLDQRDQGRMDPVNQGQSQNAPGQGKGQAYPAMNIAGQPSIVPEGDFKGLFIKEADPVFYCCGHQPAQQKDGRGKASDRRQQQNGTGAQPVDRAQGQHQQAFALRISPGDPGVGHLQQETQKAVYQKIPKPSQKRPSIHVC